MTCIGSGLDFESFYAVLCDQFLPSFGRINRGDARGLYRLGATIDESVRMISVAYKSPGAFLTDRERDLADAMPTFAFVRGD